MSIGEALSQARHRAGLTVAEVSQRTRIRPPIVHGIEQDDYEVCGGDFYARGHIRAIAAAVGVDPEPLIRDYDAAHPPLTQLTAEDLHREDQPDPRPRRRGLTWPAVMAAVLLALIGFAGYQLASSLSNSHRLTPLANSKPAGGRSATASPAATRASAQTPSAQPSTPSSPAPPSAVSLTVSSATAFGPGGTADGDNPSMAANATGASPGTPWQTDWYATADFGDLKTGTGLLLDMGHDVTISAATVTLGGASGASLQLRAGNAPDLTEMPVVATASNASGSTRLTLAAPVHARYLLVWFTQLPPDNAGTYQADVYGVRFLGRP